MVDRPDQAAAPTREQLEWDAQACAIQRDELRERLDRIRACAESDPDLTEPLRSFLLRETEPGVMGDDAIRRRIAEWDADIAERESHAV